MIVIETEKAVRGFENEAGTHTIQRVPPTEKRGRVHTSVVTVAVISAASNRETPFDKRSPDDFSYRWFSGTGAGGQKRNKVQACLELTHVPSGMRQSAHGRSRETNADEAMHALCEKLDQARQHGNNHAINQVRTQQIGSNSSNVAHRRTYRFRDDLVIDHITGKSSSCARFMKGQIEKLW